jgi:hypothetical protein
VDRLIVVSLIGLIGLTPTGALGQPTGTATPAPGELADFALEPVRPNPFDEETRIAFRLGEALLDAEGEVRVSMRVFNILHQLVAIPVTLGEDGRPGEPLEDRVYDRPGLFVAFWNGVDREGLTATAGPYFVELQVGDRTQVRKILLVR